MSFGHGGYSVLAKCFHISYLKLEAFIATDDVLETDDKRGPQSHQVHALSQKITDWPVYFGIDISLGQDPQPQHIGQPECIVLVVGIFQARVFLNLSRIGQMDHISLSHQRINQPVPVIGGLDDNADV